MPKYNFAPQL